MEELTDQDYHLQVQLFLVLEVSLLLYDCFLLFHSSLLLGFLYLSQVNALPSLELVGKNLDTVGQTFVDTAKGKLVPKFPVRGGFIASSKVDDGLEKLEVVHDIPGP